ncbi:mRNA export protein mlo3 [Penicillium macrosclerotiorum]|uniref:mRNA export protein mlo3 n=1 Tax=Penicillium macrosclerotiorum TaxID=303699 RepID=UPI0025473C0C|nr:mRNA export protein mlo3 [Penicillium macrosclerotiorum]KAJ5690440.1 mRNA export protein mlo3 [Penicillium macrosclerotiorum]
MSANLDKSLDDLVGNQRQRPRQNGRRTRRAAPKPSTGGVKKASKAPNKAVSKVVHSDSSKNAPSKIIVSGLPTDVKGDNIKEYFSQSAGSVKKVILTYDQNGLSRGIATIIFKEADTAAKAARKLNGLLVDGRPMKIEVVYDASHAPTVEAPKSLTERVSVQKSHKAKPKPATAPKAAKDNTKAGGRRRGRGNANTSRKPKTVEELDAEMVDYFNETPAAAPASGTAQPATNGGDANGDAGMDDI